MVQTNPVLKALIIVQMTVYEERKRIEFLQYQKQDDNSILFDKCRNLISNDDLESLSIQVQRLQQENQNMADELQEWKATYNEKASECDQNRYTFKSYFPKHIRKCGNKW